MSGTRFTKEDLAKKGFTADEKGDWKKVQEKLQVRSGDKTGPSNPKQALFAKGRLAPGTMNKTESTYAKHLEMLKHAGEISWWGFETITIKLAPKLRLTPDFAILFSDGRFELHDVKGSRHIYQEDAKAKMKVAAITVPFQLAVVFPRTMKMGGGWDTQLISKS